MSVPERPPRRTLPLWFITVLIVGTAGLGLGVRLPTPEPAVKRVRVVAEPPGAVPMPGSMPEAGEGVRVDGQPWQAIYPSAAEGREYVALENASLDLAAGDDSLPGAPDVPIASTPPARPDLKESEEASSSKSADAPPARRYAPVADLSAAEASDLPLLVVRRGGGRLVYHETRPGGSGDARVGLEGEWAALGRCGSGFWLDIAQPVRDVGEVRGIGRDDRGGPWDLAVAVPKQGCVRAGGRWTASRAAAADEKRVFSSLSGSLDGADLRQVVRIAEPRAAVLEFGRRGVGGRAVVVVAGPDGWESVWERTVPSGEGVDVVGVYRRQGRLEAWVVLSEAGRPTQMIRVVHRGGASWSEESPAAMEG